MSSSLPALPIISAHFTTLWELRIRRLCKWNLSAGGRTLCICTVWTRRRYKLDLETGISELSTRKRYSEEAARSKLEAVERDARYASCFQNHIQGIENRYEGRMEENEWTVTQMIGPMHEKLCVVKETKCDKYIKFFSKQEKEKK